MTNDIDKRKVIRATWSFLDGGKSGLFLSCFKTPQSVDQVAIGALLNAPSGAKYRRESPTTAILHFPKKGDVEVVIAVFEDVSAVPVEFQCPPLYLDDRG